MADRWSLHEREPRKADGPGAPDTAPPPGPAPSYWSGPPAATWRETPAPTSEEKNVAMLTHILAFSTFVVPLGNVIGPLVMWLVKRESSPYVDWHGKQVLNFNISIIIYMVASAILILILVGLFLMIAVGIFWFVATIVYAIKASNGESPKYPLAIEFLK